MEAFNEAHPDFGLKGIFYLNGGYPFKQKELVDYKLNYLLDNGLELVTILMDTRTLKRQVRQILRFR